LQLINIAEISTLSCAYSLSAFALYELNAIKILQFHIVFLFIGLSTVGMVKLIPN